jgi:hypothetical protein
MASPILFGCWHTVKPAEETMRGGLPPGVLNLALGAPCVGKHATRGNFGTHDAKLKQNGPQTRDGVPRASPGFPEWVT